MRRFPVTLALAQSAPAVASSGHRWGTCVVDFDAGWKTEKIEEAEMADRKTKERKLMALMIKDLGIADTSEPEMVRMEGEVRDLPEEELDKTLAERLGLPYPVDAEVMDRVLARVEEPERLSEGGASGFTGAPDMSHEPRPGERFGEG
jgi:hypothetical protein